MTVAHDKATSCKNSLTLPAAAFPTPLPSLLAVPWGCRQRSLARPVMGAAGIRARSPGITITIVLQQNQIHHCYFVMKMTISFQLKISNTIFSYSRSILTWSRIMKSTYTVNFSLAWKIERASISWIDVQALCSFLKSVNWNYQKCKLKLTQWIYYHPLNSNQTHIPIFCEHGIITNY
jgi:hypothetical protein